MHGINTKKRIMGKNIMKLETKDIQQRAVKDQLASLFVHRLRSCQTLTLHSLG